jgi:SNF2 family DNA or RNA helicase
MYPGRRYGTGEDVSWLTPSRIKLRSSIQIASLIGYLGSQEHKIYPFLVIVPNSTITNWVREFEKWVPHMRVVSFIFFPLGLS